MDFEQHYTAEQEAFREEVRAWLEANIPPGLEAATPFDVQRQSPEQFQWARGFRKLLGEKGWLAPTWPAAFGGGGMTVAHQVVIEEELALHNLPFLGDLGITLAAPAIMAWGSDEQKRRFIPPMLRGEVITWQLFTEPEAGSDLASLRLPAVEDGDDYLLNGQKIFVGHKSHAEWLYVLAVTEPEGSRHNNISAFIVPSDTPGVTIEPLELIGGMGKKTIYFENVRVPKANLIGEEKGRGKGWWVAQTTLEVEHGADGRVLPREPLVDQLIDYCKTTNRLDRPISADPVVQDTLAEIHIRSHVGRLLGWRNHWMSAEGQHLKHEGSQFALWLRTFNPWLVERTQEILGPYAAIDDDQWGPLRGAIENHQRQGIITHPGGTPEIHRVIMARHLSLSRTPQAAAAGH